MSQKISTPAPLTESKMKSNRKEPGNPNIKPIAPPPAAGVQGEKLPRLNTDIIYEQVYMTGGEEFDSSNKNTGFLLTRVKIRIDNLGNKRFEPQRLNVRLRCVSPMTRAVLQKSLLVHDRPDENFHIEFPLIQQKKIEFGKSDEKPNCHVEPGETEFITVDFIECGIKEKDLNNTVREIYFYIPNHEKEIEIGWTGTKIIKYHV